MGVNQLEHVLGEIRVARVELQLHACREKGEALNQALDVGIRALQPLHPESRGNARIRLREFRTHLPYKLQLLVVKLEQPRIHG